MYYIQQSPPSHLYSSSVSLDMKRYFIVGENFRHFYEIDQGQISFQIEKVGLIDNIINVPVFQYCDENHFLPRQDRDHFPIDWSRQTLLIPNLIQTLFAGTFARVILCREKTSRDYFALKILAIHDIIRLKQVEHVKNEKNILKVSP